jgi:hypothetical protein
MKIVIHPDFMQTADFIKQLPQHFAQEGELLYEGRNEVRRYRVKNEWLVVKKYKQPNIIQRIVYTFFKKSKTERAYLFAGMLRKTPRTKWLILKRKEEDCFWTDILSLPNATSLPYPKCCGNAGSTNMPQTSWPRSWCNCTKKEYYMAT